MHSLGKVYKEQGDAIFAEVPLSRFNSTMEEIRSRGIRVVNSITAHDSGKDLELLYHFVHAGQVLTMKFRLSRKKPEVPTVTGMFPSAMLFEQEAHEMTGVNFIGNKSLTYLLLSDASPKDPLRKSDSGPSPENRKEVSNA